MFSNDMFCMQRYSVYHQIKHKTMQQILAIEEMELGYLAFFFLSKRHRRKNYLIVCCLCVMFILYMTLCPKIISSSWTITDYSTNHSSCTGTTWKAFVQEKNTNVEGRKRKKVFVFFTVLIESSLVSFWGTRMLLLQLLGVDVTFILP